MKYEIGGKISQARFCWNDAMLFSAVRTDRINYQFAICGTMVHNLQMDMNHITSVIQFGANSSRATDGETISCSFLRTCSLFWIFIDNHRENRAPRPNIWSSWQFTLWPSFRMVFSNLWLCREKPGPLVVWVWIISWGVNNYVLLIIIWYFDICHLPWNGYSVLHQPVVSNME